MSRPDACPGGLVAIVVTHDRLAALKISVARLLAEPVDQVIVVDNASAPETATWLARHPDPRLTVLRLDENLGGAGGFEAGLRHAMTHGRAQWMVLLDDDARPAPGAFGQFARRLRVGIAPDVGAIAAGVRYPDGRICEMNRPSRNPFWALSLAWRTLRRGGRVGFHLSDAELDPRAAPRCVDVASFVGFFVHRDAVARVGLPDSKLFLYGDDVLFSLRLRRHGFSILFDPAVGFEHDCATLGADLSYRPLWKVYYTCRNGVSVARGAAGPVLFPAALAWYLALWLRRARHYPAVERRIYLRMLRLGLLDAALRRSGRRDDLARLSRPAATRASRSAVPAHLQPASSR